MRHRPVSVLVVLALGVLTAAAAGCKAPCLQDRMNDAGQMFRLNVGCGPGLLFNLHLGRPVAIGAGAYETRRVGFRNGYGWVWDERRYDANFFVPFWGWEDVDEVLYGRMPKTLLHGDEHHSEPTGETPGETRKSEKPLTINDHNRGWFELSLNLHLIWLGIDFGVDFGEIVDYAAGWFGLDPANDDQSHHRRPVERHDPAAMPRPGG